MSVINTNYLALVSQNNLVKSQNALGTAIERLSSGMRINSAKDDAAGQAIANRFTANIKGLTQATRNANDGISIAQTTEGSLNEINNNLQRIRELSVQAANGSNSQSDLDSIQAEIDQRLDEIDRVSRESQFNGRTILGEDATSLTVQVGANDNQTIQINLRTMNRDSLKLTGFNINDQGSTPNTPATADGLTLAGFSNVGKVGDSDQFNRVTTNTNTQAGASDIVSRMSTGDTVNAAGLNNGLGVADGDTYTYNADSNSFSFNVNGVSSSDVADFLTPAAGSKTAATITLGGTAQDVLIDSQGNITNKDNQTLYLDTTGNLTLNGGAGLSAATLDSLAARMSAPSTDVPVTNITQAGENEINTVTFGALGAGESVTVGGLTYTAAAGMTDAQVAAAFAAYDASSPAVEFSGTLDAGWEITGAGTNPNQVNFTSTQTGNPDNLTGFALGVAGAATVAPATSRAAVDAVATESTVTFSALAEGESVTVNGVELTAKAGEGGMTGQEVANAFLAYFQGGAPGKGTFDPNGGAAQLEGFSVAAGGAGELVFTRTDGDLAGIATSGKLTSNTITQAGNDAVTNRDTVTFEALGAGEKFSITSGAGTLTFTADAAMNDADVAAAFAAALQDQTSLDADTRFFGSWDFDGTEGWTVQASSGNTVTFENQYEGDDPTVNGGANLTANVTVAVVAQPTVADTAAVAESTDVTFGALTAGQAVTVNGVTLTANESMTADAVALAFQQKSTNSYEGSAATFTGSFTAGFTVGAAAGNTLTITAQTAGVSSGVTVSSPSALGAGSIQVGDTTLTVNGNAFDVAGATISADALVNEADGKVATLTIASGEAAGTYDVAVNGDVSSNGDLLYVSGDTLSTEATSETTETYFAHANGNVTDGAGNRIYEDGEGGLTTDAETEGLRTPDPLAALDVALADVDSLRSELGAVQNRFQSTIANLANTVNNLSAARSRIEDADYAVEVSAMTRAQILQQAGTSVLAQANQVPQTVLSLLR